VSDLTAFVRARLNEDEAAAAGAKLPGGRLLREVEAKRAILQGRDAHIPYSDGPDPGYPDDEPFDLCAVCITSKDGYPEQWAMDPWPCLAVRAIASVWSDHPAYRQEWKP
jgi:hypothetical protein